MILLLYADYILKGPPEANKTIEDWLAWSRAWRGSLAATSMCIRQPSFRLDPMAELAGDLLRFLDTISWKPS